MKKYYNKIQKVRHKYIDKISCCVIIYIYNKKVEYEVRELKILKKVVFGLAIAAVLATGLGFVQSHLEQPVQSARPSVIG
jgi:hypothetical protein